VSGAGAKFSITESETHDALPSPPAARRSGAGRVAKVLAAAVLLLLVSGGYSGYFVRCTCVTIVIIG
jgi:hypothetical protein